MSKKVSLFLVFGLALSFSTLLVYSVEAQHTADGQGFPIAGPLNFVSPSNSTYGSGSVFLNVTSKYLLAPDQASFTYSLDGAEKAALPIEATFFPIEVVRTYANGTTEKGISIFSYYILLGSTWLPGLSDGSHTITVFAEYYANGRVGYDSCAVCFTIAGNSSSSGAVEDNAQNSRSVDEGAHAVVNEEIPSGAPFSESALEHESKDSAEASQGIIQGVAFSVGFAFVFAAAVVVCMKKRKYSNGTCEFPV